MASASASPLPSSSTSTPSPPTTTTTTTTTTTATTAATTYTFPPIYSFPPFFTLQPNPTTRSSQLLSWSTHIQSYCRTHHLFTLTLIDALPTPLFTNSTLSRSLSLRDAKTVLNWMATTEGGNRIEWVGGKKGGGKAGEDGEGGRAWVYWRRPEEWAGLLEEWVERTGQRGAVLTLYELTESDATRKEEWFGMDADLLVKSLGVCVKRGKAQIFGGEGSEGVKFF